MVNKVLTLDTVMGSDVLQPTKLTGPEGISMPFSYELEMVSSSRDIEDLADNPAASLIGTMARIGILTGPKDTDYTHRTGMISRFELTGTFNPGGQQDNLSVYKATLLPAVQMLGRQTAFRIFEGQDVVTIINALLGDMNSRFPNFLYDSSRLKSSDFQKMEYCVQYGESTFGFLTRLMERFGIWYIFDNNEAQPNTGPANDPVPGGDQIMMAENTTMVLGRLPFSGFKPCDISTHKITDNDPEIDYHAPQNATVANFHRLTNPVTQNSWYGNFNILNPKQPILKSEKLSDPNNVLAGNPSVAGFFQTEEFPGQFENDPGAKEVGAANGQGDRNIKDYADTRMQQQRVLSSKITGATLNPTFKAGRTFTITADQNSRGEPGDYLITHMDISAYENSYKTTTGTDVLNFFFRDLFFSPFQSKRSTVDFFSGAAAAGLNNYLQNEQARVFYEAYYPHGPDLPNYSDFISFFSGGITQVGITALIPLLITDIDKVLTQNKGAYSNTFAALERPASSTYYPVAPTPPAGPQPIVHGPHLALVVGPDGIDTSVQDLYADALGRVRVRFPWDPGPPAKQGELPTPWSSPEHFDLNPLTSDQNTCWVRVSEGWAGRHFGSQFLPRIGQEVIVEFLDGNPERPIITGRVYNADRSKTNLPFPDPNTANKNLDHLSDLHNTGSANFSRSGIKTRTTPLKSTDKDRFHLLRFDDDPQHEQYLMRSQGRMDVTVMGTYYDTTHGSRHLSIGGQRREDPKKCGGDFITEVYKNYHLRVGKDDDADPPGSMHTRVAQNYELAVGTGNIKGDMLLDLKRDMKAAVGGDYYLHVGVSSGDPRRTTIIDGGDEILVKKSSNQTININWNTKVGGKTTIDAGDTIVLNAKNNISLRVGQSSIVITPSSIVITSTAILASQAVKINSGSGPTPADPDSPSPVNTNDPTVAAPAEPIAADPGDTLTPPK